MHADLYKILNECYAADFLAGNLYMNPLSFFRQQSGNDAQNDPLEGLCGSVNKDQLKQLGFDFDPAFLRRVKGAVPLISQSYGQNNLFCMYRLPVDDERKRVDIPSDELRSFCDGGEEHLRAMRITDHQEFLDRIERAISKGIQGHLIEYGIYGEIAYQDAWPNAEGIASRSAFHKDSRYSYQREWRLCILRLAQQEEPFVLSIGDISDIVQDIPFTDFLSAPTTIYPGYDIVENEADPNPDPYHVIGGIDAVGHLMYSYMPPVKSNPVRSDLAQADWHKAQYLRLTDGVDSAAAYLEKRAKETGDIEHLEMAVSQRLENNEWVKALDNYPFFLDNCQTVIRDDPARFFFPMHTILMQHQYLEDAAKSLILAVSKYGLEGEMETIMRSDVLFAMGFFDQAIPLFQAMRSGNHDPIFDYDMAVSYLHTLRLEQASHHLDEYSKLFTHSARLAGKVRMFRTRIDALRSGNPWQTDASPQGTAFDTPDEEELERIMRSAPADAMVLLEFKYLYLIEKYHRWDLLDGLEVAFCPQTIAEALDCYDQTGDVVFFDAVHTLSCRPQARPVSPSLGSYLTLRHEHPDSSPTRCMEIAFVVDSRRNDVPGQSEPLPLPDA